tara:strand:- start:168 stop:299 length:132 start_codon:yes stop_codon:yes gene_type:complete
MQLASISQRIAAAMSLSVIALLIPVNSKVQTKSMLRAHDHQPP